MNSQLRAISWILLLASLLTAAACAPAAVPTPTAAAKPIATQVPAQNIPSTPAPAAKPPAPPATKPAANAGWQAEWDKVLAMAWQEGRVTVAGARESLYRQAAMQFQKAYPDIQLEYVGASGSDFAPKILAERQSGQYLWDVQFGGAQTPLQMLKPKGVYDPLRQALLLPEVLDDSKWLAGFDDGFQDLEQRYVYQFQGYLSYTAYVNRDAVSEAELNSVDQLLEPRFKGRLASQDPRSTGAMGTNIGFLLTVKSEDWLRKLFAQDIGMMKEGRQLVEAIVRGRYVVALGLPEGDLEAFRDEGLALNVKPLARESLDGARFAGGSGFAMLINKAPHPNAAKVFLNWLLSPAGQKAFVDDTKVGSRRLDAPGGAEEFAFSPDDKHLRVSKEQYQPNFTRASEIARELFK